MIYINNFDFELKSTAVALGNFDGFHVGHQKVFEQIKSYQNKSKNESKSESKSESKNEKNIPTVIFSFYPHPARVLRGADIPLLLTREEKRAAFEAAGADYYIEAPFTSEFAATTHSLFFNDILLKKLDAKFIAVGEGYAFGANKGGSAAALKYLCFVNGVEFSMVPHETRNGVKISSSSIREMILRSEFDDARELLGRPYFVTGLVVRGRALGRTIGFPTANITPPDKALPPDGVFITQTIYNGQKYNSITNIGKNPTLNAKTKTVETHLFDFNEDIYDKEIMVLFYKKIRDAAKFNGMQELKERISLDAKEAGKYFGIFAKARK
jgi:riboflavin kinase/FMN adenylyltransferase